MLAALLSWDRARRLTPVSIQSERGQALLFAIDPRDRLRSWHLIDAAGAVRSAGAGIPVLFGALPGGTPIASVASRYPRATARAYEWVADHRAALARPLNARARAWAARVIAERERSDPPR